MKSLTSKLKTTFFFSLLFIFGFLLADQAQAFVSTGPNESYQKVFEESVYGQKREVNQPSFTNENLQSIIAGLSTQIGGCQTDGCPKEYQGSRGAIGSVSNLIGALYTAPPASGITYLASLKDNLIPGRTAYAQEGKGYSSLMLLMPVWRAFRNLAYLFFTIVFIVIGFAIMFQLKISPQAVVTVQSALPNIIIALILVTFSYAIVGLLIDLTYVAIYLAVAFLASQPDISPALGKGNIAELQDQFTGGFFSVIQGIYQATGLPLQAGIFGLGALIGGLVGALVGSFVPVAGTAGGAVFGGWVGGGLFILIFQIMVLYLVIKLFISLLKAYLGVLFSLILAPLQIMLGAIPGQSGFGSWLRGLLSNLLIFPALAIFLILARILIGLYQGSGAGLWTPPLFSFPGNIMPAILGLGILFMMNKIPDMVRDALSVKPFKYGTGITEAADSPRRAVSTTGKVVAGGAAIGKGIAAALRV